MCFLGERSDCAVDELHPDYRFWFVDIPVIIYYNVLSLCYRKLPNLRTRCLSLDCKEPFICVILDGLSGFT